MSLAAERRWMVDVRVSSAGAIAVATRWFDAARAQTHEAVCAKPSDALNVVADALSACDGDQIDLVLRSPTVRLSAWTTRSASGAAYWCAAMLGKCWPPSFVPILERRSEAGPSDPRAAQAAPLIERRRWLSIGA